MPLSSPRPRRFAAASLTLLFLLAPAPAPAGEFAAGGAAAAVAPVPAPPPPFPASPQVLTLWDCRRIALENQPTLAAYRASLAGAEARASALNNLCTPALVRPDLPIRREQACLGIRVAQAQCRQAEWETVYAVTRNYVSALHAYQQAALAETAIEELQAFVRDKASPPPRWLAARAGTYIHLARARRQEALQGEARAMAALGEAMGVPPGLCLRLADTELRALSPQVRPEELLGLALSRRGELVQTPVTARIAGLEVDAQGATHLPTAQTFSAGSDIHAQPVAQEIHDGVYRPGAITVEMPTTLAGQRRDRVLEAQALQGRAEEVVVKTRNLIALEVEDAYQRWLEKSAQVTEHGEALGLARQSAELGPQAGNAEGATLAEVLLGRTLVTQTQAEYNEAVYQSLLVLADLERITAGGFCPGFETIFATAAVAAPAPVGPGEPGR